MVGNTIYVVVEERISFDYERKDIVACTFNEGAAYALVNQLTGNIDHDMEERCGYRTEYHIYIEDFISSYEECDKYI